jgi:hypothetical protein
MCLQKKHLPAKKALACKKSVSLQKKAFACNFFSRLQNFLQPL